ncbi:mitochondrial import inner membrane translocase subunit tim54 [Coemansia javaensis]|uniref:Mitochondrial import inner membrane translocase subunit TIM54 n=1 Tax=Coemansia javaensis TaxID=2761396 RepID=A0A9W8LCT7_9FUNG|nr:mitochondrial import inner membrane translocase subunit tim54 [Coemansia javaensis]
MFAGLRKRLPGPKAAAFWGCVVGAVGFYKYNQRESRRRLEYYCARAAHVANETTGSMDVVRRVHVYVAVPMGELGTRKARRHWETYVLPVFAAGALDYELTLVNETEATGGGGERVVRGGIHRRVAEEIKERRRRRLEAAEDNVELRLWRAALDERARENEARRLKKRLGAEPGMSVLELWKAQPYPGVMDAVAIGREAWVEVVNGISDGATGSLNVAVPELERLDADSGSGLDSDAGGGTQAEIPPPVVVNYDRYDDGGAVALPAAAYIAHENLVGWGSVPQRIWNFFHDQQNVDRFASQALQVVFESTRRAARGAAELEAMGRAEEQLGGWAEQPPLDVVVDPRVADALQIYDTQADGAPFKGGRALNGDPLNGGGGVA